MKRHSTLIALLVAAAVFVGMFAALGQATDVIRLAGPAVLAVFAALGTQLALGRTPAQITDDAYHDDARGQVRACLDVVEKIQRDARKVKSASMRHQAQEIGRVVPELLTRVERTAPTSLYSSAAQIRGHLQSLEQVVTTFADIERNPSFYPEPAEQLTQGEQAVQRFVAFSLDSIRLVNRGDLAQYKANLATVAPPVMPVLNAPTPQEER